MKLLDFFYELYRGFSLRLVMMSEFSVFISIQFSPTIFTRFSSAGESLKNNISMTKKTSLRTD